MSTSLSKPTDLTAEPEVNASRRISRRWWIAGIVGLALLGLIILANSGLFGAEKDSISRIAVAEIQRENLIVSVDQPGQIQAREVLSIRSEVRGQHELIWLIEEGTIVEPGTTLAKLDPTNREERVLEQEQAVESSRSAKVSAQVNYDNTKSQSDSNVEKAELDRQFAELELKKYVEGEYPQELMKARADVEIARETYKRASNKAGWSRKLLEKGFITESEADADAAAANKANLDLQVAQGRLKVLEKYTYGQQKLKLESDVDQKRAALERTRNKATADVLKAEVDLNTAIARLDREEKELVQDRIDLVNCVIKSPAAGRVVYAPQGDRWRRTEPLSVGSSVSFNREIIHLPRSGQMSVSIKIDEAQRDKVRVGLPVLITGPNLPDEGFRGKLVRIAEYLDPSGWWNNDVKVYSATVDVDDEQNVSGLRTGMNCKTQIFVARYENAVVAPLQAVTMVESKHVVYLAKNPDQPQPVEIGLDNGRKVRIISGLEPGQNVLLDPPLPPSARPDDQPDMDVQITPEAPAQKPAKQPATDTADDRTTKMLAAFASTGVIDKLEMDDAIKAKLKQAAIDAKAGKVVTLDEDTKTQLRAAMRKLKPARPRREGGGAHHP